LELRFDLLEQRTPLFASGMTPRVMPLRIPDVSDLQPRCGAWRRRLANGPEVRAVVTNGSGSRERAMTLVGSLIGHRD
jgi:hypothetical protein